ncbi:hypothetical protein AZI86_18005 [Bdellovibrio bacteriovorus]|uniref:Lipoprotein n=1 Tax=Bdellovibrio bacteriovorus TaxID=959 RepID=A0A150WEP7_BDEBC|nr:hypothetical protein [Bdellovibrio bacteriovorus]KYG61598.1 hypothetical protein AZI86_18005 [Bdellovibrio bacteriovorus]
MTSVLTRAILFTFLCLGVTAVSCAGGFFVGNPGHVVICFDQNADPSFFNGGDISAQGLHRLKSMDVLDFYLAKKWHPEKLSEARQSQICKMGPDEVYKTLLSAFSKLDANFDGTTEACLQMGKTDIGVNDELPFIDDKTSLLDLPKNCVLKQAIIRQGPHFYFSKPLLKRLSKSSCPSQTGILRVHELLFTYAVNSYGHEDGVLTRLLVAALLAENTSEARKIYTQFGPYKAPLCDGAM